MCGIAGIISKKTIDRSQIESMCHKISHRGPDATGYFFKDGLALGHTRLSILDLTTDGNQPMSYADERYTISYNGEIYNYVEIRQQLEAKGYHFKTRTDTEVILAAYAQWGENCTNHFNGMWSFILYDAAEQHIFCSRDRFGIKPFYYKITEDTIYIGSELKQLVSVSNSNQANSARLYDFLFFNWSEHTDETFFDGIKQLLPSHSMTINLANLDFKISRYYQLQKQQSPIQLSNQQTIENYEQLLDSAVTLRLRSDVTVGGCLSGGLDSSSICTIAANKGHDFNAFTAKSPEKSTDETHYARMVVNHTKSVHHIILPQHSEFIADLDKLAYTQEEPYGSPSIYMQYKVLERANQVGIKVLLDGQGGDETLLGYERYYPTILRDKNIFHKAVKAFAIAKNSKLSYLDVWKYYYYFTHASIRRKILANTASKYFNQDVIAHGKKSAFLTNSAKSYKNLFELQKLELESMQLPHLLRFEDKNAMHHSIEARLPFLDYRLVEYTLNLPLSMKLHKGWTKYILRRAIDRHMPKDITWRKNKFGFQAPEDTWYKMTVENKQIIDKLLSQSLLKQIVTADNLTPNRLQKIPKKQFWKLLSVATWSEQYNVTL